MRDGSLSRSFIAFIKAPVKPQQTDAWSWNMPWKKSHSCHREVQPAQVFVVTFFLVEACDRVQHCLQKTVVHLSCGQAFPVSWGRVSEHGMLHYGAICKMNVRMEMVQARLSTVPMATRVWDGGEAPFHTCITTEVQNSSLNTSNESLGPSLEPLLCPWPLCVGMVLWPGQHVQKAQGCQGSDTGWQPALLVYAMRKLSWGSN